MSSIPMILPQMALDEPQADQPPEDQTQPPEDQQLIPYDDSNNLDVLLYNTTNLQ